MLARVGVWPLAFVVLLAVAIGRLPASWWVLGIEELTRVLLLLVALYLLGWVRAVVFALLPKSVVQFGRRLWFPHRGRRIVLRTSSIVEIDVELRPPPADEVFVIELDDGAVYDLCPVRWEGAERIFALLHRRVRRASHRASRKRAREQRRRRRQLRAPG